MSACLMLGALLLTPLPTLALSVGTPRLLSAYAEPLRVQVPVSFEAGELNSGELRVELVPESQYRRYGVAEQAISPATLTARFNESDRQIEIESEAAIEEPAAILLLQVSLGGTRIIKEVPLLFDFPTQGRTQPAPAPAAVTAIDAAALPAAPAAEASPVRAVTATAAAPVHHADRHRDQAQAAQPQQPRRFRLSQDLQAAAVPYTSASAGLRLAESFDSYAEYQRNQPSLEPTQGPAPEPAPQPAAAPVVSPAPPKPVATEAPAPLPPAAPPAQPSGLSLPTWLALLALAGAAAWLLWRSRRGNPAPAAGAAPAAAPVMVPAPIARAQTVIPMVVPPPAVEHHSPLRERLRRLTRGKLDSDLARRALLVEAFLDLKRDDSAARLLDELERDVADATPRDGADIAAAVRR